MPVTSHGARGSPFRRCQLDRPIKERQPQTCVASVVLPDSKKHIGDGTFDSLGTGVAVEPLYPRGRFWTC